MRVFIVLFALLVWLSPTSLAAPPTDCGETPAQIPAFALIDQNPSSPTFGETKTQDDLLGQVVVIYWAQAS